MYESDKSLTFRELLDYCSDPFSPYWEYACREFIKRYKMYLYKKVKDSCIKWNISRLRLQFSDVVNDIVNEVLLQLFKNECQALREFHARDNEWMFLSWLATICNRNVGHYIQKFFSKTVINNELEENENYLQDLEFDKRWELYDYITEKLRKSRKIKKRQLERDINIFQMYIWADFSAPMISMHPCLKDIGHRVVDNVVNRTRNYLRQNATF